MALTSCVYTTDAAQMQKQLDCEVKMKGTVRVFFSSLWSSVSSALCIPFIKKKPNWKGSAALCQLWVLWKPCLFFTVEDVKVLVLAEPPPSSGLPVPQHELQYVLISRSNIISLQTHADHLSDQQSKSWNTPACQRGCVWRLTHLAKASAKDCWECSIVRSPAGCIWGSVIPQKQQLL